MRYSRERRKGGFSENLIKDDKKNRKPFKSMKITHRSKQNLREITWYEDRQKKTKHTTNWNPKKIKILEKN